MEITKFPPGSCRSLEVIDLGVPLLSMHSPFEMSSKVDDWEFYRLISAFYVQELLRISFEQKMLGKSSGQMCRRAVDDTVIFSIHVIGHVIGSVVQAA